MIWHKGRILSDDELAIGVGDRTFEHGLGLFETMRTWNSRAPLLDRHRARMRQSAQDLGLPFASEDFPDDEAVSSLLRATGAGEEVLLRITLTGGSSLSAGSTLWMRQAPMPSPARPGGLLVDFGRWKVDKDDELARYKSLNYWSRRLAHQRAVEAGYDEVLSISSDGSLWEGSRTSLFAVKESALLTPTLAGPIVPGVMRNVVGELAQSVGLVFQQVESLTWDSLQAADEVFLTNSVRGILPVARIRETAWPAPGPWTQRLQHNLLDRFRTETLRR